MKINGGELVGMLREGASDRSIARTLGLNRRTVARYWLLARVDGILAPATPDLPSVLVPLGGARARGRPPGRLSSVEADRAAMARAPWSSHELSQGPPDVHARAQDAAGVAAM